MPTSCRVICVLYVIGLFATTLGADELKLEATPFYIRHEDQLARAILVDVSEDALGDGATIHVRGDDHASELDSGDLSRWMHRLVVPVPDCATPTKFTIALEPSGLKGTVTLKPERRWEIYIVPHTHLDIGFTDVPEVVWTQQAENLKGVIALCEQTADRDDASRFRWTIEGTALFENFKKRHPDQVERLVKLIRDGRVELTGGWANLLTELCGSEALARSMNLAGRIAEKHDLRIDTAMLNDVPGYTWAMPMLWSQMGMTFANLRANSIRGGFLWYREGAVPRPFRWEAPDGSSVIVWYTDSYREANFLRRAYPEGGAADVDAETQTVLHDYLRNHLQRAKANGYERDVLQLRMGGDNYDAAASVCDWVDYWNARWAYPKLRLATSREFYHALLRDGRPIPTYRGDIPDWWADGAASSAEPTGITRVVQDEYKGLALAFDLLDTPDLRLPQGVRIEHLYRNVLLYCEHTWGAAWRWYKEDPSQVERQWAAKRGYADWIADMQEVMRDAFTIKVQLADRHADGRDAREYISVFNPTTWERTDVVHLPATVKDGPNHLIGPNGERAALQDGTTFIARDVPPVGWAHYEIVEGEIPQAEKRESRYTVKLDAETGYVKDVLHRASGRSLVDPEARFTFNAYLMQRGGPRENVSPVRLTEKRMPSWEQVTPAEPTTEIEHHVGSVYEEWIVTTTGDALRSLKQHIRVYADLDVIDIENKLDKIADETVEQIYFGFPFAMENPRVRMEIPWVSMAPGEEQLKYSATDFYSIEHWVDLNDANGGVLWATREAPLVVLGDLWPECWREELDMPNGHIFSHIMTNTWFTNYRWQQGGKMTFRYRIMAYDGAMDPVRAERFGDGFAQPLLAVQRVRKSDAPLPEPISYAAIAPEHVKVETLKQADDERGVILRVQEVGVGDATARISLKMAARQAFECDPAERALRELAVECDEDRSVIEVGLRKHGMTTLRVNPEADGMQ